MKCFGVEIEYKTRHFTVVIVTMTIMIGLLALGFGLASARSISSPEPADNVDLDYIKSRIENSTLFENTYERALRILAKSPVVDGYVKIKHD